jgi:hypothetical protein
MTTNTQIIALAQAIGADIKSLTVTRGTLANLTTTEKSNLVAALNELKTGLTAVEGAVAGSSGINDTVVSTTTAYSSSKTVSVISAQIAAIVDGAPGTFDTLREIAEYIASDQTAMGALTTSINNRVRYDAAQTLTVAQQKIAGENIGLGDPATNFVTSYNTAKA